MSGGRQWTDVERLVEAVAMKVECPQPHCEARAGRKCRDGYFACGSSHLGRVRAAGALGMLPLVAAWVRGEVR